MSIANAIAAARSALGSEATAEQIQQWLIGETGARVPAQNYLTHSAIVHLFGLERAGTLLNTLESAAPNNPAIRALLTLLTTGGAIEAASDDTKAVVAVFVAAELLSEAEAAAIEHYGTRPVYRYETHSLSALPTLKQIRGAM
jgi:hypothetical protein